MQKIRRPAMSSTTACTSTVTNTATNLPPMIVPCRVGVVNRRGMVPSRSSVRMVRATLAAPKNMKKIIMPERTAPVTLTSFSVLPTLRRALRDLQAGGDAAVVAERLGGGARRAGRPAGRRPASERRATAPAAAARAPLKSASTCPTTPSTMEPPISLRRVLVELDLRWSPSGRCRRRRR